MSTMTERSRRMAPGSWLCLPIDAAAPAPERVDLTEYDEPRYYVVPEAERPPCPAEPAPYDLDVIRTDLADDEPGKEVWTPVDAGEVIPARIAHLPRRRCAHVPARRGPLAPPDLPPVLVCPRFERVGQVLVSANSTPRGDR